MSMTFTPGCGNQPPLKFLTNAKGGWPIPLAFVDVDGYPVDLTTAGVIPVVLFSQPRQPVRPLVFSPSSAQTGQGVATVPEAVARSTLAPVPAQGSGIIAGWLGATAPPPPCRVLAYCLDALGNAGPQQVIEIQPVDWRSADAGDLPVIPVQYVTVGPSGPAGPQGATGPQGLPGGIVPLSGTAAVNVADFQVVRSTLQGIAPATSADSTQAGTVVGIAHPGASANQAITYQDGGTLVNPNWSWAPGPVFFDANGQLTQTPPTGGFVQSVGRSIDAHTISAQLGPPRGDRLVTASACPQDAAPGPVEVWVAPPGSPKPYTWLVEVTLFDPSTGRALNLANKTPWADLYTGPGAPPQRLTLTQVVAAQGRGLLTVPSTVTSKIVAGKPGDTVFPVRALLGYTDSAGEDLPLGPLYFLPLDPSTAQVLS